MGFYEQRKQRRTSENKPIYEDTRHKISISVAPSLSRQFNIIFLYYPNYISPINVEK